MTAPSWFHDHVQQREGTLPSTRTQAATDAGDLITQGQANGTVATRETSTGLVRYDAMVRAIAEAHAVDEVKDLRDKAMALERYAQQAMNTEAERKACEIRLRAERRAGELIAQSQAAGTLATHDHGGRNVSVSCDATPTTLTDLGVTRDQSSRRH